MKTSTAILLVGGAAVVVFLLTRQSSSGTSYRGSVSNKTGSNGDSAAVAAVKGVFSLGETALKGWLASSSGSSSGGVGNSNASGAFDQQTQDNVQDALTFNGLFG